MAISQEHQTTETTIQGTPKTKDKKRLNLDLTPEAYALLQKLAEESGKNMADVLRTGLLLYGISQEEAKNGRSLTIAEGDKIITRIVMI